MNVQQEVARRKALPNTLAVLKDAGYKKTPEGWSDNNVPISDGEMKAFCFATDNFARKMKISPYEAVGLMLFKIPAEINQAISIDGSLHIIGNNKRPLIKHCEGDILDLFELDIESLEIQGIQDKRAYIVLKDGTTCEVPAEVSEGVTVDAAFGIRWLVLSCGRAVRVDPRYA